jgi:hypothetical protein
LLGRGVARERHATNLFQLGLFSLLLLASFERLPVQRLGCELRDVSVYFVSVNTRELTLRLKSAFSRPDMVYWCIVGAGMGLWSGAMGNVSGDGR